MRQFTSEEIKSFISKPLFDEKVILNKDPAWPKISIVTPSYDQAEFLERTICSVLNQNYPNLEYIIIDGGSTDGSLEIVRKYEKYVAYWVSEEDEGQTAALNKGFRMATGEIVAWLNSDDIFLPNALKAVADEFIKSRTADVVFGNALLLDKDDNVIRDMRYGPFSLYCLLYEGWNLNNQSTFWRRSLFNDVGFLNPAFEYAMDLDFFTRVAEANKNFKFLRAFLGVFRRHENTKTFAFGSTVGEKEWVKIRKKFNIDTPPYIDRVRLFRMRKLFCGVRRLFFYLLQGDFYYVLRGLRERSFSRRDHNIS